MKKVLKALTLTLSLVVLAACSELDGIVSPTIVSFNANPSTIEAGQTSTLSWTVLGGPADLAVTLTPGNLELSKSGSTTVSPSETTEYTLRAGNTTKSLSVTVEGSTGGPDETAKFEQAAKLTASDAEPEDGFGFTLAFSENNAVIDSAAAGLGQEGTKGAVYFFEKKESSWQEIDLNINDNIETGVIAMGISKSVAATQTGCCTITGAGVIAEIYKRSADGWSVEPLENFEPEVVTEDIAVFGNTLLFTNFADDSNLLSIYKLDNGVFKQSEVLSYGDAYGYPLALTPDFAFATYFYDVQTPEGTDYRQQVYTFERSGDSWTRGIRLKPEPANGLDQVDNIAADGNTLLAGGSIDDRNVIFVFERGEEGWSQTAVLPDPSPREGFGYRATEYDMGGDTIVIAGVADGNDGAGLVNVYQKTVQGWTLSQVLQSSNPADVDKFGTSVAVSDDTILVGAPADDENGENSGAVYVYTK